MQKVILLEGVGVGGSAYTALLPLAGGKRIMICHHKIGRKSPLIKIELLCGPDNATILLSNGVKLITIS